MAQANLATTQDTVDPATGPAVELLASANLTTDPSGGVSGIVNVAPFREVTLWIKASADAASAYAHIAVFLSAKADLPVLGDDSWYALSERDASAVATLITGSVPTGADYTIAPEWAVVKVRPLVIRTEESDANTDEIRMCVTFRVAHARWMYISAEEVGGNMALQVDWSGNR